eukprot:259320-Prorocentrum_minimum.AAC.5
MSTNNPLAGTKLPAGTVTKMHTARLAALESKKAKAQAVAARCDDQGVQRGSRGGPEGIQRGSEWPK